MQLKGADGALSFFIKKELLWRPRAKKTHEFFSSRGCAVALHLAAPGT
jgi:hypothetical protein